MSTDEAIELTEVPNRVKTWRTTLRITMARRVFESSDKAEAPPALTIQKTGALPAAELWGLLIRGPLNIQ
jgi:hypothetical protein